MIKELDIHITPPGNEWTEVNSEPSDLEFVNLIVRSFENLGFEVYIQEISENDLKKDSIFKVYLKMNNKSLHSN